MTEFLDSQELHALTGFARATQQATWLREKGIPFRQDGRRIIISRVHAREWLEGRTAVVSSGLKLAAIK